MNNEQRDEMLIEIHSDMKATVKTVESLGKTIWGNGKDGVEIEVDRLKVFKTQSKWFFGVIFVAGLGLIVRLLYSHLAGT